MKKHFPLSILITVLILISCTKYNNPVALFSMSKTTASVGETIVFTNLSKNAGQIAWDFGDGNISVYFDTEHAYSAAGTYTVRLVVFAHPDNEISKPTDEMRKTIVITP